MSFEETIRTIVREEIRTALQEMQPPRPTPPGPEMLTIAQAAACAGYGTSTIRKYLDEGKLNRYGDSPRNVRVSRAELERLMAPRPRPEGKLTDADIEAKAAKILSRYR